MTLPKGAPRPCKGCGTEITRLKFCSSGCRDSWYKLNSVEISRVRRREAGITPLADHNRQRHTLALKVCQVCSEEFKPSGGGPNLFCSTKCCGLSRRCYANEAESKRAYYRRKADKLGVIPQARRSVIAALKRRAELISQTQRVCAQCQGDLGDNRKGFRGAPSICMHCASANAKAQKRASKAKRRAVERGIGAERFDPYEVFNRDGWRCHMCNVKTPKRLRGSYEPNAPELDHIIPLAAGGEHSRLNTACACRACNGAKADRPLGQLRLVA